MYEIKNAAQLYFWDFVKKACAEKNLSEEDREGRRELFLGITSALRQNKSVFSDYAKTLDLKANGKAKQSMDKMLKSFPDNVLVHIATMETRLYKENLSSLYEYWDMQLYKYNLSNVKEVVKNFEAGY